MRFIAEGRTREIVLQRLSGLPRQVTILHTTRAGATYGPETLALLRELSGMSDALRLEVRETSPGDDAEPAPATRLVADDDDRGIRYLGIPSGFEFPALLEDIVMVARGDSGLALPTRRALHRVVRPLHVQVFVTPTCPYCAGSVRLAHQFAFESDRVTGEMVEATGFSELAERHDVRGVPATIVNGRVAVVGAVDERVYLERILAAVSAAGKGVSC